MTKQSVKAPGPLVLSHIHKYHFHRMFVVVKKQRKMQQFQVLGFILADTIIASLESFICDCEDITKRKYLPFAFTGYM